MRWTYNCLFFTILLELRLYKSYKISQAPFSRPLSPLKTTTTTNLHETGGITPESLVKVFCKTHSNLGRYVSWRQEMDESQAEEPEFVPCGQIHSKMAGGEEKPCLDKREKKHIFLNLKSRRPSWLHMCRKAPWRSKREETSPHNKWSWLSIGLFPRICLD